MTRSPAAAGEPGSIALTGGDARIEVVPTLGGCVRSLQMGGREWLAPGEGWDEEAGGERRPPLRDVELRTGALGHMLRTVWRGDRHPWTLTRTLIVRPDGVVEARYEAVATGHERLGFDWRAHLLMPLEKSTRLKAPDATRFFVQATAGLAKGEAPSVPPGAQPWPRLALGERAHDLSRPWALPRAASVSGWLDLVGSRAPVQVTQGDRTLAVHTDGEHAPHCGLLLDRAGARTGRKRGLFSRGPAPALAVIPSLGAGDDASDRAGDARAPLWLVPGEPRKWTMTLSVAR